MTSDMNAYDRLLIDLVLTNGTIQGAGDYRNPISEYEVTEHLRGNPFGRTSSHREAPRRCGWGDLSNARLDESASWTEWTSTFEEGTSRTGMEVTGVACSCGKIRDIKVRWEADTSEAIHTVMRRLAELGALNLGGLDER